MTTDSLMDVDDDHVGLRRSTIVARQLREIFVQEGIKSFKQSTLIAEVLQIGSRTARRKLNGDTPFSEEELTMLLANIGYDYLGLSVRKTDSTGQVDSSYRHAKVRRHVRDGGIAAGQVIRLDADTNGFPAGEFAVVEHNDGSYTMLPTKDISHWENALKIVSIELLKVPPQAGSGSSLVVYDDNEKSATMNATALSNAGFRTTAIWTPEMLDMELATNKFDAFLFTWNSWQQWRPVELATKAREVSASAPIIFSTGEEDSEDPDLLSAADKFDSHVIIQPEPTTNVVRVIMRELRKSGQHAPRQLASSQTLPSTF